MAIHSPAEKVNLPKASTNVQLDKETKLIALLFLGKLVQWPVAMSFGHHTHSLTLLKTEWERRKKATCVMLTSLWIKSEILQGFHLYYFIYSE